MLNAATIAAIVAACWAHPSGVAYLAKIDQIEALSISCGNPCCKKGVGTGTQSFHKAHRKQRLILVEEVRDLVEQMELEVREEPKVKSNLRKAKQVKPESLENTADNAQAWLNYYSAILDSLRDQQKAEELRLELEMVAIQLNALWRDAEIKAMLLLDARRREDEEILFMLMVS